jgi:hypothetical protein
MAHLKNNDKQEDYNIVLPDRLEIELKQSFFRNPNYQKRSPHLGVKLLNT